MTMLHEVEKFTHVNRTVKVYIDPDPINPRTDWDNATILAYWHTRLVIGDIKIERMTEEEIRAEYEEKGDPILAILPLNAYIHSGITVSTSSYTCRWDSGQVGWAFVTKSKKELMGFPDSYTTEMYEEVIKQDVKSYDDYLTGQVFGYEVVGKDGDVLESCWGYVGCKDDCISDAKAAAGHSVDPGIERDAEELASRATYAGVACIPTGHAGV